MSLCTNLVCPQNWGYNGFGSLLQQYWMQTSLGKYHQSSTDLLVPDHSEEWQREHICVCCWTSWILFYGWPIWNVIAFTKVESPSTILKNILAKELHMSRLWMNCSVNGWHQWQVESPKTFPSWMCQPCFLLVTLATFQSFIQLLGALSLWEISNPTLTSAALKTFTLPTYHYGGWQSSMKKERKL